MSKTVIMATWDDVPHLNADDKAAMLGSYPPYQRDARSKGVPMLGSGAIYPIPEDDVKIAPFDIPAFWPRAYGLDVGWKKTAAIWLAHNRETDVMYLYDAYYRGQEEPDVHAGAIKRRGEWMCGAIDPAARGRSQADGEQLIIKYRENGLDIIPAINAVEAGLYEVYQRLSTGRLRVFAQLFDYWTEYRLYRRDEKGKVVKEMDHLMDAKRYAIMTAASILRLAPDYLRRSAPAKSQNGEFDPYRDEG